jgi:hypothetical protein
MTRVGHISCALSEPVLIEAFEETKVSRNGWVDKHLATPYSTIYYLVVLKERIRVSARF